MTRRQYFRNILYDPRLTTSFAILLVVCPFVLASELSYTTHYRNVFYFADSTIAQNILDTGHTHVSASSIPDRWGKIISRARQPVQPIFMAIATLVTGMQLHIFQSYLPLYVLVFLLYLIICRLFVGKRTAFWLSLGAAIGPNMKIITSMGAQSLKYIFYLMIVYLAIRRFNDVRKTILAGVGIPLLLVLLLYTYPRLFVLGAIFSLLLWGLNISTVRHIVAVSMIFVGGYVIVSTPFPAYVQSATGIVKTFHNPEIIINSLRYITGSTGTNNVRWTMVSEPYTRYTFPIPAVIGSIGGIIAVKRAWFERSNQYQSIVAWGLSAILFILLQFSSGLAWVASRAYVVAFPIMIVGTAIGLQYISQSDISLLSKSVIPPIFFTVMICFFILSAQSSSVAIQTYSLEEEVAGEWIDSNVASPVLSDMRLASLPSSKRPVGYYPRSESMLYNLFYSENATLLRTSIRESSSNYFFTSDKMQDVGVYAPPNSRQPVSHSQHTLWNRSMSSIYDNGQTTVFKN